MSKGFLGTAAAGREGLDSRGLVVRTGADQVGCTVYVCRSGRTFPPIGANRKIAWRPGNFFRGSEVYLHGESRTVMIVTQPALRLSHR